LAGPVVDGRRAGLLRFGDGSVLKCNWPKSSSTGGGPGCSAWATGRRWSV